MLLLARLTPGGPHTHQCISPYLSLTSFFLVAEERVLEIDARNWDQRIASLPHSFQPIARPEPMLLLRDDRVITDASQWNQPSSSGSADVEVKTEWVSAGQVTLQMDGDK